MNLSVKTEPGIWRELDFSAYVICNEKASFLAAYQRAAEEYAHAAKELGRAVGAVIYADMSWFGNG